MVIQFCYAARLNVSSGGSICYKYSWPLSNTLSWPKSPSPNPQSWKMCLKNVEEGKASLGEDTRPQGSLDSLWRARGPELQDTLEI